MKDINESTNQKISNPHPSDKVLANFINKRLSKNKREIVLEHLIYCNDCSDIVAFIIKNIKRKY